MTAKPPAAPTDGPPKPATDVNNANDATVVSDATVPPDPARPPVALPVSVPTPELTRAVLATLGLLALIVLSLWVLRPFLAPLIWASAIVVATWPLMLQVERALWQRRGLAVAVMTVALLVLLFVPLTMAVLTVLEHAEQISGWLRQVGRWRPSEPPAWLLGLPWVGARIGTLWHDVVAGGPDPLVARVTPYIGTIAGRVLREAGAFGITALEFVLTIAFSAVLYAYGESAADAVRRFVRRLAGDRGEAAALLAAASVRGVAMGVVVTALVQSLLGGLGLAATGVPAAALLTVVMFLLTVAQVGPMPVLVPAVIWLYWIDQPGLGTALLVWTAFVGTMDNFLRPWLIRKGADMPLLLVFCGVVGGLLAFGLIGLFIGPVVLVVTWRLLEAWMSEHSPGDRR
jgi:predicted PurR-regulated permease PerM